MSVALTPWPTGPAELARATAAVASALGMRRDDADPQVPFLVKLPDDTRHLSVDVGPSMGAEHTIRAVTSIEEIGTSDLTISEITHTGAVIAFLCAGGIEGQEYQLLIRWQTEPDIPVGSLGKPCRRRSGWQCGSDGLTPTIARHKTPTCAGRRQPPAPWLNTTRRRLRSRSATKRCSAAPAT